MRLLVLFAIVGLVGCATTNLTYSDSQAFEAAIQAGDTQKAEDIVASKPSLTAADSYHLIVNAVGDHTCKDALIKQILAKSPSKFPESDATRVDHNAKVTMYRPGAAALNRLAQVPCPKSIEALLPRLSKEDVAIASSQKKPEEYKYGVSWEEYPGVFKVAIHKDAQGAMGEQQGEAILSTFKMLQDRVGKDCTSDSKAGSSCKAKSTFDELVVFIKQMQQQVTHENSPEGIFEAACAAEANRQKWQGYIDRENKAGAVSGAVNYAKLRDWGHEVIGYREKVDSLSVEHEQLTGKKIDVNNCRISH